MCAGRRWLGSLPRPAEKRLKFRIFRRSKVAGGLWSDVVIFRQTLDLIRIVQR